MRIELHATGIRLTNHTRHFLESKLQYRLHPFKDRIGSVEVNLTTSQGGSRPGVTACEIVVNIESLGEIRRRAEHEWLHIAIDWATSAVVAEVERAAGGRAA
jgi:ribosomal subunit interface protein